MVVYLRKLLEIERSKSVFRLLACFSTKMLKIAYKVVEMTELWSKVSYLDEKVKKNFFGPKPLKTRLSPKKRAFFFSFLQKCSKSRIKS